MKILLVDDHALFRDGLALLLRKLADEVDVIEAYDSNSAFDVLSNHPDVDFMLLDLNMPGEDGFSILEATIREYPTVPVAILSASTQQRDIDKVMATSAMGYINKNTPNDVILGALKLMLAGGLYTPPTTVTRDASESDKAGTSLTERQIEVLAFLVDGHSNKQIAVELGVAEATIKMHVTGIFKALGVENRTQAALAGQALL